jgi:nucleoside-diphosphate-sugar epimerase
VARALIVGCGCRGRELGRALAAAGWQVRGTSRDPGRLAPIEDDGIEAVLADPDRVGTVLEHVDGVALVFWLLGSARGDDEAVAALCGPRLERMLEEIVDTPVRGFVYEAAGTVPAAARDRGAGAVRAAAERWRIPVEIVAADPSEPERWRGEMLAAAARLTASGA